ncbi:MAG: hypothetical protein NO516_05050 [Candidatus Methanomethylicia archaeon]|nr:hypothetical protein [Candidatus Methanomethylicia archaeon]
MGTIERCIEVAKEIRMTADLVQAYEDCERVSDLICDEGLCTVEDPDLRNVIREMRALHYKVREGYFRSYARKAEDLFSKIPSKANVLKYHEIEELLSGVSDEEIRKIPDDTMREILLKIKHVHDKGHSERKLQILSEILGKPRP